MDWSIVIDGEPDVFLYNYILILDFNLTNTVFTPAYCYAPRRASWALKKLTSTFLALLEYITLNDCVKKKLPIRNSINRAGV
jgi:hypothetical protein